MAYIGAGVTRFNTADQLTVTGDATIDTTTLVVDSTNNRVGIGTSSPSSLFEVNKGSAGTLATFTDGVNSNFVIETASLITTVGNTGGSTALAFKSSNTERMRIDSSGNVLVGKTSANGTTGSGHTFYNNGEAFHTRAGTPMFLNRTGSDGSIVNFYKDGSTVGSIGVSASDDFYIGASTANHAGIYFGTDIVYPMRANSLSDGVTSIGHSSNRFNNLYLSGGVYLGGTGAANLLDDYEEGSWTPTMHTSDANLTATIGIQFARYVKIGQLVYVSAYIVPNITAGSSGYAYLSSLPFAVTSASGAVFPWFCVHGSALSSSGGYLGGNGRMIAVANNSTSGINWNAGIQYLMFNCSYMTDA